MMVAEDVGSSSHCLPLIVSALKPLRQSTADLTLEKMSGRLS
jgi:hypothetical protein